MKRLYYFARYLWRWHPHSPPEAHGISRWWEWRMRVRFAWNLAGDAAEANR